jgi:membrane-bound ClpP family serine protease
MGRTLRLLLAAAFVLAGVVPALAAEGASDAVVVADVRGPLEQRALDFLTGVVENEPGQVVVLQLNNPGIASGDPSELYAAVAASTRPVTAWVGPSGAEAYGGVAELLTVVVYRGAAPGAKVGYLDEQMAGAGFADLTRAAGIDESVYRDAVEVSDPIAGIVDEVVPTIGQFIATLDGRELPTAVGPVVLDTTAPTTAEDGSEIIVAAVDVRFLKPGLIDRFLRLAIRPEAMLFFLLVGLATAAFEFYAAGVGITAGVAVVSLFLAGFGIASLPMRWISLVAVLLGMLLYTVDFQNTVISWRGILGTLLLVAGGLTVTDAAPQFGPRWWAVILTIIGVAAFYMVAMTTVARSRFSTRTIGREHRVGRRGRAETAFEPFGVVEVDGARWRARSHRAAGIAPGDAIEVLEVTGIMLEVAPLAEESGRFANS